MPKSILLAAIVLLVLLLRVSPAHADTLWDAELRLGYGVTSGQTATGMTTKTSPLTVTGMAAWAFSDDPPLMGYGGFTLETLDRNSIGGVAGVKLAALGALQISAGGVWIFAPYTLWGATATFGACHRIGRTVKACGDLQLVEYFAGTDLPKQHAMTQAQLAFGIVFDGGT